MHMKKKVASAVIVLFALAILLFPVRMQFRDGGTTFYTAILYRVISWNALINEGEKKTGTEVHLIPNNFHSYEYYFNREASEPDATSSTGPAVVTRPDLMLQREAEKDGLVLRVSSDYQFKFTGEPFVLTASITNTTDRDITYGLASGTPDMHLEIHLRMEPDFIDMDTYGKAMNTEYRYAVLKAGETFTQTMNLLPGTASGGYWADLSTQEIDWYPAGEYRGTAVFSWIPGTPDNPGETKRVELEFPIILFDGPSGDFASSAPPPPAASEPAPKTATEAPTKNDPPDPVVLTPERAVYPVGTKEITVTWFNGTDEDLIFGDSFVLQKWQGGKWAEAEPVDRLLFLTIGYFLTPGESREKAYDIGHYFGPLQAGRWRIASHFFYDAERPIRNDNQLHQVYAEFEIK